jgi:hypothetical protein
MYRNVPLCSGTTDLVVVTARWIPDHRGCRLYRFAASSSILTYGWCHSQCYFGIREWGPFEPLCLVESPMVRGEWPKDISGPHPRPQGALSLTKLGGRVPCALSENFHILGAIQIGCAALRRARPLGQDFLRCRWEDNRSGWRSQDQYGFVAHRDRTCPQGLRGRHESTQHRIDGSMVADCGVWWCQIKSRTASKATGNVP